MKIVLVVHIFFPHWRAGTEVYALNLARSFRKSGHEVQLVCYEPNTQASAEVTAIDDYYEEFPVHRISYSQSHPHQLLREYFNPAVETHLIDFYRHVRPDVVHVIHSMHLSAASITAARFLGLPVICTATDFWYICPTYRLLRVDNSLCTGPTNFLQCTRCYALPWIGWDDQILSWLGRSDVLVSVLKFAAVIAARVPALRSHPALRNVRRVIDRPRVLREILSLVDVFIAPNSNTQKILMQNGISARRVMVLSFGLSLPAQIRATKEKSAKLRLAYIGTLDYAKGPHVALAAIKRLENRHHVELAIYGDPKINPDYFCRLKQIAGSDPRIRFAGTFPNEQIGQIFSEIDLLVIPSLWYENTPLVLFSAFATQTPVAVSNIGSLADAVCHGQNGLVFEVGSADDLARQIQSVLDDPSSLERLRSGIPHVKPIDRNAEELLEIYAALSAHRAISKPPFAVTSLSKWLKRLRLDDATGSNSISLLERVRIRAFLSRRGAHFGQNVELCRCQYSSDGNGQVRLRFVWRCAHVPEQDSSVVVELVGSDDKAVFRAEHQFKDVVGHHTGNGSKLVAYSVPVRIPEDLHHGSYHVRISVWDPVERRFLSPTRVRGWREESSENIRLGLLKVRQT
jgi:glycosyltransferase involved in cell wall biosynthesis